MTPVFINSVKKWIYKHENLCQHRNIGVGFCVWGVFSGLMFLYPIVTYTAVISLYLYFFFCFNAVFPLTTPIICSLWTCKNNFCISYFLKDIVNGGVSSVILNHPVEKTRKTKLDLLHSLWWIVSISESDCNMWPCITNLS